MLIFKLFEKYFDYPIISYAYLIDKIKINTHKITALLITYNDSIRIEVNLEGMLYLPKS